MASRLLLAACVAVTGCTNSFDPTSLLAGLRVLGVVAEPPELAPGGSGTLRAVAVQVDDQPITYQWSACTLPPVSGSGDSLNLDCVSPNAGSALAPLGDTETLPFSQPQRSFVELGLPDFTFGFYYPIILRATSGGETVTTVYRVRYHVPLDFYPFNANPLNNQNPKLDQIFIVPKGADAGLVELPLAPDDPPIVHTGDRLTLRASFVAGSSEHYTVPEDLQKGPPRGIDELLRVSWFATGGSLTESVTGKDKPNTELRLDKHLPAPGQPIVVYIVGRDERGGTDWTRRVLMFER